MGKGIKLEYRLGIGYAIGAIVNVLLLASAMYGLSLVTDPFFLYFAGLEEFLKLSFIICVDHSLGD